MLQFVKLKLTTMYNSAISYKTKHRKFLQIFLYSCSFAYFLALIKNQLSICNH